MLSLAPVHATINPKYSMQPPAKLCAINPTGGRFGREEASLPVVSCKTVPLQEYNPFQNHNYSHVMHYNNLLTKDCFGSIAQLKAWSLYLSQDT